MRCYSLLFYLFHFRSSSALAIMFTKTALNRNVISSGYISHFVFFCGENYVVYFYSVFRALIYYFNISTMLKIEIKMSKRVKSRPNTLL